MSISAVVRAVLGAGLCALLVGAPVAALAQGPELERGRALYEARCDGCHEKSVHQRDSRLAKDFAQVRAAVARWDRETGSIWRPDEVDAVARYLNDRYYRFPCPSSLCRSDRAQMRTAMVRWPHR
jgi:hypothetical protein